MEQKKTPYKELGEALKAIRARFEESLEEVSGAVELDPGDIADYEEGTHRPSEDILDLLITHFSVKEHEAVKLWKLAGYELPKDLEMEDGPSLFPQPVVILPLDTRIIYSDNANVMINDKGVVINFMQNSGVTGKQLSAAKVGMSLDQAKRVLVILSKSIESADEQKKRNHTTESEKE